MVWVKAGSDASQVMAFFSYFITRCLNLLNCRSGKRAILRLLENIPFQLSYSGTLFTMNLQSLAAPPMWFRLSYLWFPCADPLNLFAFSDPSQPYFLIQVNGDNTFFQPIPTPLAGRDTLSYCSSLTGRYQALPAAQGLGTCTLSQQLRAEVSAVPAAALPAGGEGCLPGCAATAAALSCASISIFPASSHMQTAGQATIPHRHRACAGPARCT